MNKIDRKWISIGGGTQLFLLVSLSFLGAILSLSISQLIFGDTIHSTAQNIRLSNSIGTLLMFLFPVAIYSYLFAGNIKGNFLNKRTLSWLILLLGMAAMLCIQPFITFTQQCNELIQLPESMAELSKALNEGEEAGKKAMNLLFEDKTIGSFLLNIFVLAVLPGIMEELFFRGCMQRSFLKANNNIHIAIWLTAIIFSFFHFQFSGFFPRIFLGAFLGYLYAWGGNIWIPIAAHFINNAGVVILEHFFKGTPTYDTLSSQDSSTISVIISLVLTILILTVIYRKRKKEISESPSY